MRLKTEDFKDRLNSNDDFSSSSLYFDGIVLVEMGSLKIWIKIFMGKVIAATQTPLPFGYTFALRGTAQGWRFALDPEKNRLREALFVGKLRVEGNTLEYNRMARAVHGLTEVLREMGREGQLSIED